MQLLIVSQMFTSLFVGNALHMHTVHAPTARNISLVITEVSFEKQISARLHSLVRGHFPLSLSSLTVLQDLKVAKDLGVSLNLCKVCLLLCRNSGLLWPISACCVVVLPCGVPVLEDKIPLSC